MNNQIQLICPICRNILYEKNKSLVCKNSHSFDIARQGYVNLLTVQNKHSLNPGDAKEMLVARRDFLNTDKYLPICRSVIDAVKKYSPADKPIIADIGCGEGYYTSALERECNASCIGVDISKNGVKMACSRSKNITWLAATAAQLPISDCSVDIVTAMFSLLIQQEYARVLKRGGCVIEVTVGEKHLIELKEMIYDEVFKQYKHPSKAEDMFEEVMCEEYSYKTALDNIELQSLLLMTPHFWRIHREKREQLGNVRNLSLTVNYYVRVLKKL